MYSPSHREKVDKFNVFFADFPHKKNYYEELENAKKQIELLSFEKENFRVFLHFYSFFADF